MLEYYEENAEAYAKATFGADMSEARDIFSTYLTPGSRLLDVGSGSGRDAAAFTAMGYQVTALEPSKALCQEIGKVFSGEVICKTIQQYRPSGLFDGIWACASLLHLTEEELLTFFENTERYAKKNGVIYVSGKSGITTGRQEGRFFLDFSEELLEKVLETSTALSLLEKWYSKDVTGRENVRWMNFVLRYTG